MQDYKNHQRYSVLFHLITLPLLLAVIIGSFFNLFNSTKENIYSASLICLLSILVMIIAFKARGFALKAQDRAIRSEENFRCPHVCSKRDYLCFTKLLKHAHQSIWLETFQPNKLDIVEPLASYIGQEI